MSAPHFGWYQRVTDGSLDQGDFIADVPLVTAVPPFVASAASEDIDVEVALAPVVVLTQSCDLEQGKTASVVVCPHFFVEELEPPQSEFNTTKGRRTILQGRHVALYAVPACLDIPTAHSTARVLNFRQLTTVPIDQIRMMAEHQLDRPRLLPPYREHLAQALARFLSRVALPEDYPDF